MHVGREWFAGWHTARICHALVTSIGGADRRVAIEAFHPHEGAAEDEPRDPTPEELEAMRRAWRSDGQHTK